MMSARPWWCGVAGRPRSHGSQEGSRLVGVTYSRARNALLGPVQTWMHVMPTRTVTCLPEQLVCALGASGYTWCTRLVRNSVAVFPHSLVGVRIVVHRGGCTADERGVTDRKVRRTLCKYKYINSYTIKCNH